MSKALFYSEDRSIILRVSQRYFFTPVINALPLSLKPNVITIGGFIAALLSGVFIILATKGFTPGFLLAAASLFVYLICDNIDGMHARNTNQTSTLGGFLDQWFDSVCLFIITMSLLASLQVQGALFISVIIILSVACLVLYLEQCLNGCFYKPAFGPNEFIAIVILIYISFFFFHGKPQVLFRYNVLNEASLIIYTAIILSVLFTVRGFRTVKAAVRGVLFPIIFYSVIVLFYMSHRIQSPVMIGALIALVNAFFVALYIVATQAKKNKTILFLANNIIFSARKQKN